MSGRLTALMFAVLWAALPQIACLVPATTTTKADDDCCEKMEGECPRSKVPSIDACCLYVVRSDVSMTAKATQVMVPDVATAALVTYIVPVLPMISESPVFLVPNFHAPPPDLLPPLNLRI